MAVVLQSDIVIIPITMIITLMIYHDIIYLLSSIPSDSTGQQKIENINMSKMMQDLLLSKWEELYHWDKALQPCIAV